MNYYRHAHAYLVQQGSWQREDLRRNIAARASTPITRTDVFYRPRFSSTGL